MAELFVVEKILFDGDHKLQQLYFKKKKEEVFEKIQRLKYEPFYRKLSKIDKLHHLCKGHLCKKCKRFWKQYNGADDGKKKRFDGTNWTFTLKKKQKTLEVCEYCMDYLKFVNEKL